jgi:carboxyl-terminal processing protease
MNKLYRRFAALLPGLMVIALAAQPVRAKSDAEQIGLSVGRLLEEGHYTHHPLNDEISRKLLTGYLEMLDFSHLFFTQKDVDAFTKKYGTALDDDILLGNLKPAHEIFDVFQKRVEDRVKKIKELVKQPMDFKTDETVLLSRQKRPGRRMKPRPTISGANGSRANCSRRN